MKNAVFVMNDLNRGGAQKMMVFVANTLIDYFDEIYIIVLNKTKINYYIDPKINLKFLEKKTHKNKLIRYIIETKQLRTEIKQIKPLVVSCFGIFTLTQTYISLIGITTKLIASERRSPKDLPLFWFLMTKILYLKCYKIVFQLDEAKNQYGNKIKKKSMVIPNPYLENYSSHIIYDSSKKEKIITSAAARLEFDKGFDLLIKAFSIIHQKHQDYFLHIYGIGDSHQYDQLIKMYNLENYVSFMEQSEDIVKSIINSSVFVLPSRNEGIPNILIEVLAAGIPTISFDCPPGGPRFLTKNGEYGLLIEHLNYEKLAEGIISLIEDDELSNNFSKKSVNIKQDLYAPNIAKMWKDCYNIN